MLETLLKPNTGASVSYTHLDVYKRQNTDFAAVNQARNIRKVSLCTENYRGYFLSENRGKYRYQVEFVMFSSNFADCAVDFTCQYVIIW